MKIRIECKKTAASGNAMHWMGNSFLCSEYMKMQKRQLKLWFSEFCGEHPVVSPTQPTALQSALHSSDRFSVLDFGASIIALAYTSVLVLHTLNVL